MKKRKKKRKKKDEEKKKKKEKRDGLDTRKIEIPYRLQSIQGNSISHLLNERLKPVLSNKEIRNICIKS